MCTSCPLIAFAIPLSFKEEESILVLFFHSKFHQIIDSLERSFEQFVY